MNKKARMSLCYAWAACGLSASQPYVTYQRAPPTPPEQRTEHRVPPLPHLQNVVRYKTAFAPTSRDLKALSS
ncbi:hypothetical protein FA10DRAFT_263993 [Acaromyces ingoldii]|uniref:Uncharacterized protein n=1 Tax=Acaromyces ingoldii TaxID=215250 RepID=A0A316YUU2_9BASI|nr:hypothetical protein FA10DRAFT_263993 [Acaromyces ingoldii]PWN93330.1 hypothetical protein FA10DRAFT_263993 [Acaromyces ingoldii]